MNPLEFYLGHRPTIQTAAAAIMKVTFIGYCENYAWISINYSSKYQAGYLFIGNQGFKNKFSVKPTCPSPCRLREFDGNLTLNKIYI